MSVPDMEWPEPSDSIVHVLTALDKVKRTGPNQWEASLDLASGW